MQRHKIAKIILKKTKAGGLTLSEFETYSKDFVKKTAWHQQKYGTIEQGNKISSVNGVRKSVIQFTWG